MPLASFTPDHKPQTRDNFPRLKLVKDEKARIVCIEEEPTYAYVHTLRAPKIVNGEAVTELVEKGWGDNKYSEEDFILDFISNPICTGDEGIIKDKKGLDPHNCLVCSEAVKNPDMFRSPDKRFAWNIVKYVTKPGSFDVRLPFGVEIVVWAFSEKTFGTLFDIVSDIEDGDLKKVDLFLGPCTVEKYQKYDIRPSTKKAAWLTNEDTKRTTLETYKNNKATDLESYCGRKMDRKLVETDIETVKYRWAIARKSENKSQADEFSESSELSSLSDDLENILEETPEKQESSGLDVFARGDDIDSTDTDDSDVDVDDFESMLKDL